MTLDLEKLDALVADGWLRSQRHPEADLWIYNYTEKTQYENYWTPETLLCRGLIVDGDGFVVARPFSKFFNYGTPQAADLPAEPFTVTEKIDGSLGILYYLGGEQHIATRGSFVSEQAIEGTRMLRGYDCSHAQEVTPLFEIVYPENRIVVDYGGRRELVLLAGIDHHTGRDAEVEWNGPVAERHDCPTVEELAALEGPNREGFVVAFESGFRVKVKFAEYVRLHKIVTGVTARMIWEALRDGASLDALLDGIPDEIHQWIVEQQTALIDAYTEHEMACAHVFDARPQTDDRRTLAEYFMASGANPSVLFRRLDGKPYDDLIWKAIKPGVITPGWVTEEDIENAA